jgi:hypothetical protein
MKKTMFFLMLWLISLASACRKKEVAPIIPIQFELRLINEQGVVSTQFREGENFKLSFIMKNPTDSTWAFRDPKLDLDFFKVYDASGNDLGKPFGSAFCSYEPVGGTKGIDPKGVFEIVIPWVVKDSTNYPFICAPVKLQYLRKGSYKTGFKNAFEFLKNSKIFKTDVLNFNINFSII